MYRFWKICYNVDSEGICRHDPVIIGLWRDSFWADVILTGADAGEYRRKMVWNFEKDKLDIDHPGSGWICDRTLYRNVL